MLIKKQKCLRVVTENFNLPVNVNLIDLPSHSPGWDDTGITLDLPYAGHYIMYWSLVVQHADAASFDNRWVVGLLHDTTISQDVPGGSAYLSTMENLGPNGDFFPRQNTMVVSYTTDGPRTIKLLISRHSVNTTCAITNDYSHWGYTCIY